LTRDLAFADEASCRRRRGSSWMRCAISSKRGLRCYSNCMKNEFAWYLGAIAPDYDQVWNTGVLTLDANVLLDLYRYNETTRSSILNAIASFGDRVWVSGQAAGEFFHNRRKVIVSAGLDFDKAKSRVEAIRKAVTEQLTELRKLRVVSGEVSDGLETSVAEALAKAADEIDASRSKHPDYLREDPVLERLLAVFEGRVGEGLKGDNRDAALREGAARFKAKRPPGYMDEATKEGDRRYGDYLMWAETVDFAKAGNVPIILVTSERKEDWWEEGSGRILGPRWELVQEFHEQTGQQIIIYQTDRFAHFAAERAGASLTPDIAQEIREVSARRSRTHHPAVEVEQLPQVAEIDENLGTLEIDLLREVTMMTGSGRLDPPMGGIPEVRATVIDAPAGCPTLDVRCATGTTFDFNVHIRPIERGRKLPIGHYVVEYDCAYGPSDTVEAEI